MRLAVRLHLGESVNKSHVRSAVVDGVWWSGETRLGNLQGDMRSGGHPSSQLVQERLQPQTGTGAEVHHQKCIASI